MIPDRLLDPGELLREWFATFYPDALPAIESHMGPVMTGVERSWLWGLRRHFGVVPRFEDRWGEALKTIVDEAEA